VKPAPGVQKKQEKVSSLTEGPLSPAQASKVLPEPWTEAKLRRAVKAGRLRSVVLQPDPSIKSGRGRKARIGIFLDDVRWLDQRAADIVALRGQLAAKVVELKKKSVVATAPKQKGPADAPTRN